MIRSPASAVARSNAPEALSWEARKITAPSGAMIQTIWKFARIKLLVVKLLSMNKGSWFSA